MKADVPTSQAQSALRPVGPAEPEHERAVRGFKALREGRLHDVERNIDAIPETPVNHRVWRLVLKADLALERGLAEEAEACAVQALGVMAYESMAGNESRNDTSKTVDRKPLPRDRGSDLSRERLIGVVLLRLGQALRRKEKAESAMEAHRLALQFFENHGSLEDQWAACRNLALDAEVGRKTESAIEWHRMAVELAGRCEVDRERLFAVAVRGLARCRLSNGNFERAVADFRAARDAWRKVDPGGLEAVRGQRDLAEALVDWAKVLFDRDSTKARELLVEAVERLRECSREFAAFGANVVEQTGCAELCDFAERMLTSLPSADVGNSESLVVRSDERAA